MPGTTGRAPQVARPDTLIANYVFYYGIDSTGEVVYFVRWDDGRWVRTKLFPDFNSAHYSVDFYEEYCREIIGNEDASWFFLEQESVITGALECRACDDEGCIACQPV